MQIKIFVNGQEKLIKEGSSVADLASELDLDLKKIAVEKDLEILLPNQFAEVTLQEGAKLEIVHFIGGG